VIAWALYHAFVWLARISVLVAACFTIEHAFKVWGVSYNLDVWQLFFVCLIALAVIRVWMPWRPFEHEKKGERHSELG